ncbi:MAG: AIR synthase family protein [Anaerolineales bacterium]
MNSFPVGKIPASLLESLWRQFGSQPESLILGPGVGRDVAVVDIGDEYLVAKTDPITFATDNIGWYAVHVNANDVACSGAQPEWFMATLLLPESQATQATVESIFQQLAEACHTIGASLIGGHTEVTHGIDRPIIMGCLLGRVAKDQLVTSEGAQAGDAVLLTGGVPIEATAIIGREKAAELQGSFSPEFIERCQEYLFDPGISVLQESRLAVQTGPVHAMHDPTEGGLLTGLWELAQASEMNLLIEEAAIPIVPEGGELCRYFGLDPLATIASGALLLTIPEQAVAPLLSEYQQHSITCLQIGEVIQGDGEVFMVSEGERRLITPPERDEIARLFEAP